MVFKKLNLPNHKKEPSLHPKKSLSLFLLILAGTTYISAAQNNAFLISEPFDQEAAVQKTWKISADNTLDGHFSDQSTTLVPARSGKGLLAVSTNTNGSIKIKRKFTAEEIKAMRGATLIVSVWLKSKDISVKPRNWNGVKVECDMWVSNLATSMGEIRAQATLPAGSMDWTNIAVIVNAPKDLAAGILFLGLESVSGEVIFDDLRVRIFESPDSLKGVRSAVRHKWHPYERLRGFNIIVEPKEEIFSAISEWNANVIRWNIGAWDRRYFHLGLDSTNFDAVFASELLRADQAIALAKKNKLLVVLDLMGATQYGLFRSSAGQERFFKCWETLAKRYASEKTVIGYDLANEPHMKEIGSAVDAGVLSWNDLVEKASVRIRAVDPVKTIVIEGALGGSVHGLAVTRPVSVSNVVYSPHMYEPFLVTHQRIPNPQFPQDALEYPGMILGTLFDKKSLEQELAGVVEFQKKYNVPIFVGEFSCIRWAPNGSAYRWIRDCIELFEKYEWDWAFHSFRDFNGWSTEHSEDREDTNPSASPTDREKLLKEWFSKNQRPQ